VERGKLVVLPSYPLFIWGLLLLTFTFSIGQEVEKILHIEQQTKAERVANGDVMVVVLVVLVWERR